jgi:hypothetical protein
VHGTDHPIQFGLLAAQCRRATEAEKSDDSARCWGQLSLVTYLTNSAKRTAGVLAGRSGQTIYNERVSKMLRSDRLERSETLPGQFLAGKSGVQWTVSRTPAARLSACVRTCNCCAARFRS